MASDQTHSLSTESQLTLIDIEELRKILGAEADLGADADSDPFVVRIVTHPPPPPVPTTVMCPQWY